MKRYAVIAKELDLARVQDEVKKCGGRNIKVASISRQVFCDLDDAEASKLQSVPGLVVKLLKKVKSQDNGRVIPPEPGLGPLEVPIYASSQVSLASELFYLRSTLDPPITGKNITIAILDSGIRHTHEGLKNKVIYEANFSDSPDCVDHFDHGTGVAYCAAGGRHSVGEEGGSAPGAQLWNIKVLDDNGEGSEENCVMGIEHCIERKLKLMESGLSENDPQIANLMNISWGAPDDGDPDNPIRVACKAALEARIGSVAAAGNGGPALGSVMSPACDPNVVAVGALTFVPFEVWELSSRGPTKEGLIKPDLVFYGVRVLTASSKSDSAFVVKSGTSFSTPYVTGFAALTAELMRRKWGGVPEIATEVECIEEVRKAFTGIVPPERLTVKPEGYTVAVKDNDYGHGMPLGSLVAQAISPVPGIGAMVETVTPIIGLGMVGMMMSGMMKGMKV